MMKIISLAILLTIMACSKQDGVGYKAIKCDVKVSLNETNTLKIGDSLKSFTGKISVPEPGKRTILFFRNSFAPDHTILSLVNNEIEYKNLGEKAQANNINLWILNDLKIVKSYGLEIDETYNLKKTTLIVANENGVIEDIYENACENDILNFLERSYIK